MINYYRWAVGILLFEMLAGHPPFYDQSAFLIYKRVLSGRLDFPFHMDQDAKVRQTFKYNYTMLQVQHCLEPQLSKFLFIQFH